LPLFRVCRNARSCPPLPFFFPDCCVPQNPLALRTPLAMLFFSVLSPPLMKTLWFELFFGSFSSSPKCPEGGFIFVFFSSQCPLCPLPMVEPLRSLVWLVPSSFNFRRRVFSTTPTPPVRVFDFSQFCFRVTRASRSLTLSCARLQISFPTRPTVSLFLPLPGPPLNLFFFCFLCLGQCRHFGHFIPRSDLPFQLKLSPSLNPRAPLLLPLFLPCFSSSALVM